MAKLVLLAFFILGTTRAWSSAEISLSNRHIILLQADLKTVWGLYYFGVRNESGKELSFSAPVALPEGVEYKPGEGVTEKDFTYDEKGRLHVTRLFGPGLSLVSISFQKPVVPNTSQRLDIRVQSDISELSFAIPKGGGLSLHSAKLTEGLSNMLNPVTYEGLLAKDLREGELVQIEILGIPNDRTWLWGVGAAFSVLIFLSVLLVLFRNFKNAFA